MPDLEQNAVTAWLTVLRPDPTAPAWPPPIREIETQEDVPDRLAVLGATFDAAAQRDPQAVAAALRNAPLRDEMAALLAQLGAARVLLAAVQPLGLHLVTKGKAVEIRQ